METQLDILGDYVQILRSHLRRLGYSKSSIDSVEDHDSLILAYFRALRRFVSNEPRVIYKAKGFVCPPIFVDALSHIEGKITKGENLSAHLSRKLPDISYNDPLLNSWGIQHLHLQTTGTKQLLYVYFGKQSAYFIAILDHHSFSEQTLIQIIHDNWPEVLTRFRIAGTVYPRNFTSKERHQLRKANLEVSMVTVSDGTSYVLMGGGVATSGDNSEDVRYTNRLHEWAHHQTEAIRKQIPEIVAELKTAHGIDIIEPIVLRLRIADGTEKGWFLVDDNNQFEISIMGPWGAQVSVALALINPTAL